MPCELPDLFRFAAGHRVATTADWRRRRAELQELILDQAYGRLPAAPASVRTVLLHRHNVARFGNAEHSTHSVVCELAQPYRFTLEVFCPPGEGPFPVVLYGDNCWSYRTEAIIAEVVRRGYLFATFNRCEIVPDVGSTDRREGIYPHCPGDYGALAAWAWGYHRCVDALLTWPRVDAQRIAITGHSRGGKTVLLAGATDERIALTNPNNSGCGGAGCYRWPGEQCERLADILKYLGYWFCPRLHAYIGREDALPFDQHSLKALVAPRALLSTEAHGDLWANPSGTWQTHRAVAELYAWLGAPDQLGAWYRPGAHEHGEADWRAFLDFADWRLRGLPTATRYDQNPFPDLPPAHTWTAPRA
jgi:hypothetical protein